MITRHFPLIILVLTLHGAIHAQAPVEEKNGFFSFINAIALPGKTSLAIDGKDNKPEGFTPGFVSGGIGLPIGSHVFTVECGSLQPVSATVTLVPGKSPIVVAYSVDLPPDPQTGVIKQELKLVALDNKPAGKKRTFYALYLGNKPSIDLVINERPQTLPRFQEEQVSEKSEKQLVVTQGDKNIVSYAPLDKGNFLVIFFDAPDGTLSATETHDVIYEAVTTNPQ